MKKAIIKTVLYKIIPLVLFIPIIFYVTYLGSGSILISIILVALLLIVWDRLFGDGLRKREKYVNILFEKKFPFIDDDPLLNSEGWENGVGVTDEVNQPMWVKVDETGIALFYLCFANKMPFLISWNSLSQIKLINNTQTDEHNLWVRLYIPGVGMKLIIPWNQRFNVFVPEDTAFE